MTETANDTSEEEKEEVINWVINTKNNDYGDLSEDDDLCVDDLDAIHAASSCRQIGGDITSGVNESLRGSIRGSIRSDRDHRSELNRNRSIRSELSQLSGLVADPTEKEIDDSILVRTLKDIGFHGYGLMGISVWMLDDESDRLLPKGWWKSPSIPKSKALGRLFDPSRSDYVPQEPVMPGIGLVGNLWKESQKDDMCGQPDTSSRRSSLPNPFRGSATPNARGSATNFSRSRSSRSVLSGQNPNSTGRRQRRRSSLVDIIFNRETKQPEEEPLYGSLTGQNPNSTGFRQKRRQRRRSSLVEIIFNRETEQPEEEPLSWRDIKSLVSDPDTAKGPRLALLEESGFYKAAGVTFKNQICQGIVVYYIEPGLDQETLDSLANITYLKQSTYMTGSCLSMTKTRRASVGYRIKQGQHITIKATPQEETKPKGKEMCPFLPLRVKKLQTKIKGGGMQIPPAPNASFGMWTTLGCFWGLLTVSALNHFFRAVSNDELFIVLGPFGAVVTLQYGLPGAPASQPRNLILGHSLAGAISLLFTYIPEYVFPLWFRQVLAPAVAIGLICKCGFVHPPAGAHAVILASGRYGWGLYAIGVLGTIVSIIPAVIVNNLSNKRRYPSYWGFGLP